MARNDADVAAKKVNNKQLPFQFMQKKALPISFRNNVHTLYIHGTSSDSFKSMGV